MLANIGQTVVLTTFFLCFVSCCVGRAWGEFETRPIAFKEGYDKGYKEGHKDGKYEERFLDIESVLTGQALSPKEHCKWLLRNQDQHDQPKQVGRNR